MSLCFGRGRPGIPAASLRLPGKGSPACHSPPSPTPAGRRRLRPSSLLPRGGLVVLQVDATPRETGAGFLQAGSGGLSAAWAFISGSCCGQLGGCWWTETSGRSFAAQRRWRRLLSQDGLWGGTFLPLPLGGLPEWPRAEPLPSSCPQPPRGAGPGACPGLCPLTSHRDVPKQMGQAPWPPSSGLV